MIHFRQWKQNINHLRVRERERARLKKAHTHSTQSEFMLWQMQCAIWPSLLVPFQLMFLLWFFFWHCTEPNTRWMHRPIQIELNNTSLNNWMFPILLSLIQVLSLFLCFQENKPTIFSKYFKLERKTVVAFYIIIIFLFHKIPWQNIYIYIYFWHAPPPQLDVTLQELHKKNMINNNKNEKWNEIINGDGKLYYSSNHNHKKKQQTNKQFSYILPVYSYI